MPFDPAPVPWKDEHIQGYLNYVRFMVKHFKGRVFAWELWNEPLHDHRYGWGKEEEGHKKYAEIIQKVVPVIREEDPNVLIMASGTLGKMLDIVAEDIDIIDVVRYYEISLNDPKYRNQYQRFLDFKKWIEDKGFKGKYYFSQENQWHGAPYPFLLITKMQNTEIEQAKNLARTMSRHAGMGIVGFWNETWNSALTTGDVGLLRHGFNAGNSHNMTVRPGYYVYRTLCTALADCEPDLDLREKIVIEAEAGDEIIDMWAYRDKAGQPVVGLWMKGDARNKLAGMIVRVAVPGEFASATGIDVLNGREQQLIVQQEDGQAIISDLRVYDYPLIIKLRSKK